jgi:hypothetical protein
VGVWNPPEKDGPNSRQIWAPEIHHLEGRWYIYYAADDGDNDHHRLYVLESDRAQGAYREGNTGYPYGRLADSSGDWAIDPDSTAAVTGCGQMPPPSVSMTAISKGPKPRSRPAEKQQAAGGPLQFLLSLRNVLVEDRVIAFLRLLERLVLCNSLRIAVWWYALLRRGLIHGNRDSRTEQVPAFVLNFDASRFHLPAAEVGGCLMRWRRSTCRASLPN